MPKTKPFFSIITISYNQAQYLGDCLRSVSMQKFESYEHIVVDPGSSDGSRDVLLGYSGSVELILEPDSGPPDGLNKGFKRATGTYALFVNADDYLLPDALASSFKLLQKYSFPDILFLGGVRHNMNSNSYERVFPGSIIGIIQAIGLSYFFQQGTLIKLSAFRKTHFFNTLNQTCWDGELFLEILSNPELYVVRNPRPVAVFRLHPDSITGSNRLIKAYPHDKKAAVQRYYSKSVYRLHELIPFLPPQMLFFIKYFLDPRLLWWRLSSFFLSKSF